MMTSDYRPTSGYRPISDTAYDTATNEKPTIGVCDTAPCEKATIGAFTLETLDMQAETSAMLCKLMLTISGEECTATPVKPADNLISRLAGIKENQRDIMIAVKTILDML